jgi:cysteine desulfurase
MDASVLAAMKPYFSEHFHNPSATYEAALVTRRALASARGQVAHWLGARPAEIIFTAGGTEANNLAIHGVMRQFPGCNVVVSSLEHESVLAPASRYDCRLVGVKSDGRLDLEGLLAKIDDKTVLLSVMYANNEIGTIQAIREIAKIIGQKRQKMRALALYFHTDACQAANYLDLHAARLGVDLMTLNGGKIYGPKQSGALYVKAGLELLPIVDGGGQEGGLRSGTENVAGAIGFAVALDLAQAQRHAEVSRLRLLQRQFLSSLSQKLPDAVVNGSLKYRLPNNVHITLPDKDNERLLIQLDEGGVQAAAGSACSASDDTPSHVLKAIGASDEQARSSLRFTMGRETTPDMIEQTVALLRDL